MAQGRTHRSTATERSLQRAFAAFPLVAPRSARCRPVNAAQSPESVGGGGSVHEVVAQRVNVNFHHFHRDREERHAFRI